jgi:hypothetical protein
VRQVTWQNLKHKNSISPIKLIGIKKMKHNSLGVSHFVQNEEFHELANEYSIAADNLLVAPKIPVPRVSRPRHSHMPLFMDSLITVSGQQFMESMAESEINSIAFLDDDD